MYNKFESRSTKRLRLLADTFNSVEKNVLFDEQFLNFCENHPLLTDHFLRIWEPTEYGVVLGVSNKQDHEVIETECMSRQIPIIKRNSGGGTVLLGPGCLCYTFFLRISDFDECQTITQTNRFILSHIMNALESKVPNLSIQGYTDICIDSVKISGNAQKRKRNYLLFHGTFLYDFNIQLMAAVLNYPTKSPNYRVNRDHTSFVRNVTFSYLEIVTLFVNYFTNGSPILFKDLENLVK